MQISGIIFSGVLLWGIAAAQTIPSPSSAAPDDTSYRAPAEDARSTETAPAAVTKPAADQSAFLEERTDTASSSAEKHLSVVDTAQTQGPIIEEIEEDLILDGGEESILAPVATEPPVQPLPTPEDSAAAEQQQNTEVHDSAVVQTDSLPQQQKNVLSRYPSKALPRAEEIPPKPLLIEKTRSINFAKNFKEYRSPKVAILLSLLVPGAGQAYAHHKLKTGIFGAIEVGFIAAGAIVSYQGNKKVKDARSFANAHYSLDSMTVYHDLLIQQNSDFDSLVFFGEFDNFKNNASKRNQSYYDDINDANNPYVQGWDDVTPRFNSSFELVYTSDSGTYVVNQDPDSMYLVYFINNQGDTVDAQYGFSDNQKIFQRKLSKANAFFRWSKGLFTMLLINHIVSAVDAGITAKAYNDKLLGKTSFWQNVNLRENIVSTPAGHAQGYALEVRF